MQVSPWHHANASDVLFWQVALPQKASYGETSIFYIIQPWYLSYFPCQDEPVETCKVLEQLGYIEQHSYVMSRHVTSFYVMVR